MPPRRHPSLQQMDTPREEPQSPLGPRARSSSRRFEESDSGRGFPQNEKMSIIQEENVSKREDYSARRERNFASRLSSPGPAALLVLALVCISIGLAFLPSAIKEGWLSPHLK